ncbi:sporulation protein Cse60 [Lysinibacillus sp. Bpr_S20]|uniref:sporulation protein Cse60 n=1 Tax=Lysinibacillus sp. Bpr_S20 TaxID=2933964 RepID=UPI0020132642|nr:sporulation protein Cse60 [Lysinibacillus sp. Bpr_S20]MCL1696953.1 sporulation protein Cse60 [Lysinibacillus sp. BPa_S21]
MTKIKIFDSRKKEDFENQVNEFLLQGHEIIDIKYSASVLNNFGFLVYSAMIIYK